MKKRIIDEIFEWAIMWLDANIVYLLGYYGIKNIPMPRIDLWIVFGDFILSRILVVFYQIWRKNNDK